MKLKTVKDAAEVELDGVAVEFTHVDSAITAVTITDQAGRHITIRKGDSYGEHLRVLIPEPPKSEERFFVVGRFMGMVDVEEAFEHEHEAKVRLSEYERKTGAYNESGLKVEKRVVLVAPSGEIVKTVAAANVSTADAIPF